MRLAHSSSWRWLRGIFGSLLYVCRPLRTLMPKLASRILWYHQVGEGCWAFLVGQLREIWTTLTNAMGAWGDTQLEEIVSVSVDCCHGLGPLSSLGCIIAWPHVRCSLAYRGSPWPSPSEAEGYLTFDADGEARCAIARTGNSFTPPLPFSTCGVGGRLERCLANGCLALHISRCSAYVRVRGTLV